MPVRIPPGRAGRPELLHRLEVARSGADILQDKRHALLVERRRLAGLLPAAEASFVEATRTAAAWHSRALALAGARLVALACARPRAEADVAVRWRNALGAVFPAGAVVSLPRDDEDTATDGAVLVSTAAAHRRALEAAADYAALRVAHDRLAAELAATTRRLRAIERRWIPEHERALRRLELALDESEREDAARVRSALAHESAPARHEPGLAGGWT